MLQYLSFVAGSNCVWCTYVRVFVLLIAQDIVTFQKKERESDCDFLGERGVTRVSV